MTRRLAALLCLLPLSWACSTKETEAPAPAPAAPAARFYSDLGPAAVDVSGYPRKQQESYKLFLAVCGACHGTARPLNSPYVGADSWKRFVRRMHVKMESRAILPSAEDERRILDFLVYDSQVRKLDKGVEFQAQQEKLRKRFGEAMRSAGSSHP